MSGLERIFPKARTISDEESREVEETLRLFAELQTYRNVHAGDWETAAALILPTSRNTFYYGSYNFPGMKKTEQQIDASGGLALQTFVAIVNSIVTPRNTQWHGLAAGGRNADYVMKDRKTREWFENTTRKVFAHRYASTANFFHQQMGNWQGVGAFGNASMFIDKLDGRLHHGARGLRYRGVPLGETFFAENHQGMVTTMVRWFRGTAEQAVQKWGVEWLPEQMRKPLEMQSQTPFNFLHCVKPRDEDDYDPQRLDAKGKPFESYYVSIEGKCLMGPESGYRVFPYGVSRYAVYPGEVYARGPAQIVLPALKTLNSQKRTFLTQGHRAAAPVLLLADDGLMGMDLRPGAINKGGVTADGKPLVHTLPSGNIDINEKMMDRELGLIEDTFLARIFKTLAENPNMTATQVIELVNERGMLVAPTLGGQFEYVSQMAEREIDLLGEMGELDPMPPRLREARGEYQVIDTSPLAKLQRAGEAAGFVRWVDTLREIVAVTQDPSWLDPVNADVASPELAEINGVPVRWTCTQDQIAVKRKTRAKQQSQAAQIQALPAQAAMVKAQAMAAKTLPPQQGTGQPSPMQ